MNRTDDHLAGQPVTEDAGRLGDHPTGAEGRSLRSNLAALATSQLTTWVLTLLWTLVVPRLLGPEVIGLLVIATSLSALVTVSLTFATRDFLVREMVSDPQTSGGLLTTALLTRLSAIPLVLVAAFAYGQVAGLDAQAMVVMYLTALTTSCTMLLDVALATFQASERMHLIAGIDVGSKSLNTLGAVLLAVAGFGIIAIAGFGLLVALIALSVGLRWVHRLVRMGARPAPVRQVLGRAKPYWLISVLLVAYVWVDSLMLGVLVPAEVVGWYGAATRLFATMGFVAVIVATATLPRLVAAHEKSPQHMFEVARQPFEWVVIAGLPLGVGMACIAGDLIHFLYGGEYSGADIPLAILAVGLPLTYLNIMANQIFVASGRPAVTAKLLATASGFNIVLNLLLIPYTQRAWGNGAIGASLGLLLTEILQAVLCLAILGRAILVRGTLVRIGSTTVATLCMAGVVLLTHDLPWPVQVAAGAVAFIGVCLVLRVPTPNESALIRSALGRVRLRRRAS